MRDQSKGAGQGLFKKNSFFPGLTYWILTGQNIADTETVDTTEDIGTLCDRHISTS